jgi:hypothetical protein
MTQTARFATERPSPLAVRWLSALAILTMLLSACGSEQAGESTVGDLEAQDALRQQRLDGDWVVRDYAEALVRTRDPQKALAAVNASEPILLRISRSEEGEAWLAVLNFHEGVWSLVQGRDTLTGGDWNRVRFARPFDLPLLVGEHSVREGPDGTLTWRIETESGSREWVLKRTDPSVEQWASRVVLTGSYTDGAGRPIDFGEDGGVVWEGVEHQYRIYLDMVGVDCPYLDLVTEAQREPRRSIFGFRREGELLLLFDAGSATEPMITCEGTPLLVLTPR